MDDCQDEEEKHPTRRNAVGIGVTVNVPSPDPDKKLRMIVLGASRVGKTQLVARFLGRPFSEAYLPTVEQFHRTKYMIRGRSYQLDILDTSGHSMSPIMQNLTLLTGDLFMVVYSVTDESSWERAKELVGVIEQATKDPERANRNIERSFQNLIFRSGYQGEKFANGIQEKANSTRREAPIPIIVVGTKGDLPDVQVRQKDVVEWLRKRPASHTSKLDHFIASSKTDNNVRVMFDRLFAMSHLPCEFSPYMHRKLSAASYMNSSAGILMESKKTSKWGEHSSLFHHSSSNSAKRGKARGMLGTLSDSDPDTPERSNSPSSEAIATVCPNQRRPSVDTEVLLAFAKVRAYAPQEKNDTQSHSPLKKLKKALKLKFPSG